MKKYKIGYIPGTFDLFHIGHLNLIRNARQYCDKLICAVSTDEVVESHKNKRPVIPFEERIEIVRAIRYVDEAVPQTNQDKYAQWKEYGFDAIFGGSDLLGTPKWLAYEAELKPEGVDFIYFEYTKTTSSTLITKVLKTLGE